MKCREDDEATRARLALVRWEIYRHDVLRCPGGVGYRRVDGQQRPGSSLAIGDLEVRQPLDRPRLRSEGQDPKHS